MYLTPCSTFCSTAPSPGATQRSLAPSLGGASAAADVAALNASYFDPDAYLKRVLKETRLADLAALQRDMLGEVGGLDSDMQVGRQAGWGRRGCTGFAPWEEQPWRPVAKKGLLK